MTDGPASSAEGVTSFPVLPESARSDTSPEPSVDFKFSRPPGLRKDLNTPVLGHRPYVVLEMTDDGLRIFGGGIAGEPDNGTVAEFLMASGDAISNIARHLP